jgi:membrane protease YdiL (CAAX protease family)
MTSPWRAAAVYIALMALGMAVMHHGFGLRYGEPEMAEVIVFVEVVLSGWAWWAARRQPWWPAAVAGRPSARGLAWLAPVGLAVLVAFGAFAAEVARQAPRLEPARWRLLAVVALTTALVGFSEELMFRGVLLRGLGRAGGLFRAMALSAVGFALLHAVNVLGGSPPAAVAIQVAITFLIGLCWGPLAVKLGALWPLMVVHWLWDFTLFGLPVLGTRPPLETALMLPVALLCIPPLWWSLRGERGAALAAP